MQIYLYCINLFFFIWIIRNILFWTSLWQVKEYRFARLWAHIRETVQGKELLTSYFSLAKWALLFSYAIVVFNDKVTSFYQIVVGLVYIAEVIYVLTEVKEHRIRRPVFTPKAVSIAILTFASVLILFLFPITDSYLWLLVLDRLVVLFVSLFVFFFAFPTEIMRDIIIQKAIKKVGENKKLITIAVSGSYGKSSTKEFIAQLLEEKYSVIRTSNSVNTPIGVAHTILSHLTPSTDVLVIEMGTDKKGDNSEICQIVMPNISVTTAVSDQHLSIFKNIENVFETEMELIDALPKSGIALFNGNSDGAYKLYKKTRKKKILYRCEENGESLHADLKAKNIQVHKDSVTFELNMKSKKITCKSPLLGAHTVENILPAIYIADYLGISMAKIKQALAHLTSPPKTMMKLDRKSITYIDDTFNASPESVLAAAEYLKIYPKKKIIVLMPLIELGSNSRRRHFEIGERLGQICDFVFLTNTNFYTEMMSGMNSTQNNCKLFVAKPIEIVKQLKTLAKKGDIILFEGKEAGGVLKKLISYL